MWSARIRVRHLCNDFSAILHGHEECFVEHAIGVLLDGDAPSGANGVRRDTCELVQVESSLSLLEVLCFVDNEATTGKLEEFIIGIPVLLRSVDHLDHDKIGCLPGRGECMLVGPWSRHRDEAVDIEQGCCLEHRALWILDKEHTKRRRYCFIRGNPARDACLRSPGRSSGWLMGSRGKDVFG